MAGYEEGDIFGNASLFEDFCDTATSKPKTENDNVQDDDHSETVKQMKDEIDELKQENHELKRQMRLLIHPGNPTTGRSVQDAPLAQVLFFNHDAICFCRHEIEDFFEQLTSQTNGDAGGVGIPDDVRPMPQTYLAIVIFQGGTRLVRVALR
ncbi:zinc finger CCHC domain-containing protein 8-like [Patiria miniata]|uniref:Uncharacterized protein n=1 Tax=Patiria miniata TaxID=46514 RepID=A0A914AF64_PATMI|nr:zinc finger CCHC domain-containing protein 8-like [Patiria miniata]